LHMAHRLGRKVAKEVDYSDFFLAENPSKNPKVSKTSSKNVTNDENEDPQNNSRKKKSQDREEAETELVNSRTSKKQKKETQTESSLENSVSNKESNLDRPSKIPAPRIKSSSITSVTRVSTPKEVKSISANVRVPEPKPVSTSDKRDDLERLKEKYEALKNLRETEVERMYQELKRNSEAREEASDKLIAQLKDEQDRLRVTMEKHGVKDMDKEIGKYKTQISTLNIQIAELTANSKQMEQKVQVLDSICNFYRRVLGMTVSPLGDDKFECNCVHSKQSDRSVHFELGFNLDEAEFVPLSNPGVEIPDYMKEPICFEQEEVPVLINKVLSSLYKKIDSN